MAARILETKWNKGLEIKTSYLGINIHLWFFSQHLHSQLETDFHTILLLETHIVTNS